MPTLEEPATLHIETYFTALEHYKQRFDLVNRQLGFSAATADEYTAWKTQVRGELAGLIGTATMVPCDPSPRLLERETLDGYVREKILLQTEPDVWMPFYLLIPDDLAPGERRPVVLAPHGHASCGKFSPAGRTDIPALAENIRTYNYDYGVALVREGFVVCCPDARGFGERREQVYQGDEYNLFFAASCNVLNHMAIPLGQTVTGMWTWDLMRLVDYTATRPECDATRVGCAGLSGGGLQTLWLTAMDDRIKSAVVSGYFYGVKESLLVLNSNCSCNYVPHLWEKVDMGDLGALIAPRPLLIETGTRDPLNGPGLENVTTQLDITRRAYALFSAEQQLYHDVFEGEHRWNGIQAIPWLKTHLEPG